MIENQTVDAQTDTPSPWHQRDGQCTASSLCRFTGICTELREKLSVDTMDNATHQDRVDSLFWSLEHGLNKDDTLLTIAMSTRQGLSSCHAINTENNEQVNNLVLGSRINVPLRCACPTKNQTDDEPAPLSPPLTTSTSPIIPVSDNNSKKTWVYIVVGVVGGFVDLSLLILIGIMMPLKNRKHYCQRIPRDVLSDLPDNLIDVLLMCGSCSGPNKLLSPVTNDDVDEVSASFSDVMLNHLRTVKFTGTTGIKPEMELIKLPLDKSPMLVRMIVEPDQGDGSCEIRLKRLAELTKFRRASPEAEVLYII
ncbi:hypothetical protein FXO38_02819 [Capsicum annuum]|nr:hypothetical protein FXO38_02819 [Capsicum annuum]